jgi:hypothetical protein
VPPRVYLGGDRASIHPTPFDGQYVTCSRSQRLVRRAN